ncbi:Pre-mRNA-splicing factor CWC2 [Babesia sp. Xinjiang]|uniref:Pre-mRNA-splicing factor CWC2 n=1 Tax=Babesia sp. Xinjiang TaxID=462227 RepID=UPI000A262CC2|nr:Pre-mRNA-splicing factor CWC2 [Babesia sp. Xinjiang]ORM41531.1 Pre-mRNA-splicing factor CWC2 [Babesia sp. Xinjiang]
MGIDSDAESASNSGEPKRSPLRESSSSPGHDEPCPNAPKRARVAATDDIHAPEAESDNRDTERFAEIDHSAVPADVPQSPGEDDGRPKDSETSGDDDNKQESSGSDAENAPPLNSYAIMIREKIEAGELDQSIVDSLQLQRLVDGCAVPLGQEVVEEAVAIPTAAERTHLEELMSRPARQQIKEFEGNAYIQGSEEYNIWYNKWSGERTNTVNGRATLMPAMYKLDPERDSGYTRGSSRNTLDDCGTKYCCLFFAKGCCTLGVKCNYLHRVPTVEDEFFLDSGVDIFGRERHAKHRDDMSGVGSFMTDCKSLFIGDVYPDNAEYNPIDNLKQVLTEEFGRFGRIVELNLVPAKGIAFVTYESRVIAEFAKVAMASQPLGNYSTALNVKWAHDMKKENRKKGHERAAFEARVKQHESQLEVFQEYFLKSNFNTTGPSAAEQAQSERAARERESQRLNKLHQILQDTEGAGEERFDVIL